MSGQSATRISWLAAIALLIFPIGTLGAEPPAEPVRLVEEATAHVAALEEGELGARIAELRLEALLGSSERWGSPAAPDSVWLELALDGGLSVALERTELRSIVGGGRAWLGKPLDGGPGGAVLLVRNGRLYGSVRKPGLNLQIRPLTDGRYRLSRRDESWWPELREDFVPVWEAPVPAADEESRASMRSSHPVVDVLVVYTADARVAAGGTDAMEALIALGELETNSSYANAGVSQRIRVVRAEEVVYTETGNAGTDLTRIQGPADGFLDEVHALRDTFGADVVSFWLENTGCGLGYLMTTVGPGFASSAFNVCRRTCATGNLTFGHELGHNMALRHDWYVDDDTSPFGYNHGFVDLDVDLASSFRTVMAYGNRCADTFGSACTRLQYFSNPSVTVGGDDAGIAAGTSVACLEGVEPVTECDADNQQALDATAATLAAFRPTQVVVRIDKQVDLAFANVGDTVTYTLTVTNDSDTSAPAVVIQDTVPNHTSLNAGSLSGDASTTGTAAGSLITWNTGETLDPGETLQRTFTVDALEGGIAINTAAVDTPATSLTVGSNTVATAIWGTVSCGFADGFETGALSHYWRVGTTQDGRVRVIPDLPDTGSFSAVLDDAVNDGTSSQAGLELAANLAGLPDVQLDFRWAEAADENGSLDGVFVREAEGDAWVNVLNFVDVPDLEYQTASIDLDEAAAANSLALTDGFQIRFQFQDNASFVPTNLAGSDGYAIDNVSLGCDCSYELTDDNVTEPLLEQSACTLFVGPNYVVDSGGVLTLRSAQSVVLRNGFSVEGTGELVVENASVP